MKRLIIFVVLVSLAGAAGVFVRSSSGGAMTELRNLVSHNNVTEVRENISQTYELSPGARVELQGLNGAVTIETSDSKTAEVLIERKASSQEALERRRIVIEADANSLRIRSEKGDTSIFDRWLGSNASERVSLKLPRQISLAGKGINGAFTSGEIDGPVEVTGVNGRVQIAGAKGTALFKGINGNMSVALKKIEFDGVTLAGINGNIELQCGPELNADFEARGLNGRVVSDLPNVAIDKGKKGKYWARIGSGGAGITAKGINGNIRLTRSPAGEVSASAGN